MYNLTMNTKISVRSTGGVIKSPVFVCTRFRLYIHIYGYYTVYSSVSSNFFFYWQYNNQKQVTTIKETVGLQCQLYNMFWFKKNLLWPIY